MKCLLRRMLDETEFLSDYGVRAISKIREAHPYTFGCYGNEVYVKYEPAESSPGGFWRKFKLARTDLDACELSDHRIASKFYKYYGSDFKVECPSGSGRFLTIREVANELARRLTRIFLKDESKHAPVFNNSEKMRDDPNFRDYILFYEYFYGENGRGLGASHQTGWTGLVANLLKPNQGGLSEHKPQGSYTHLSAAKKL
jgi:hypothetical protein